MQHLLSRPDAGNKIIEAPSTFVSIKTDPPDVVAGRPLSTTTPKRQSFAPTVPSGALRFLCKGETTTNRGFATQ